MGVLRPATIVIMLAGLPLLGVTGVGGRLAPYFHFPPNTFRVEHAPFSWPVFAGIAVWVLASILPLDLKVMARRRKDVAKQIKKGSFPRWGWVGLAFLALAWIFAWSRFPGLESVQVFSFSPLWFAYIVVVNALTELRGKPCMLRQRPRLLFVLSGFSLVFWWFFEYLNRFAQNWYYTGIGDLGPLAYFIYASLPFATVLPAVAGTYELFASFPSLGTGLDGFIRVRPGQTAARIIAWAILALSALALWGIGAFPDLFFFALWVAPLGLIVAFQVLSGRKTVFSDLREGRWRTLYLYVLSALFCGIFWEMWNMGSLAQWHYAIPFVERFRVFEMPYLGYSGYLPFGIECYVVVDMIEKRMTVKG